jgi:predicted enzyme related to lactoylglutathione lyase
MYGKRSRGGEMLADSKAVNGFAVDDVAKAREFYEGTLGLGMKTLDEEHGVTTLALAGGRETLVYEKSDFVPATYTILNFEVEDIDATADALAERGVELERYEGMDQDERGIARGPGPQIAWFTDPAGNILSVMQLP